MPDMAKALASIVSEEASIISEIFDAEWRSRPYLHTLPFVGLEDIIGSTISEHPAYQRDALKDARTWDIAMGVFAQRIGYGHTTDIVCMRTWGNTPVWCEMLTATVEPSHPVLIQWLWDGDRTSRLHCMDESDAVLIKLFGEHDHAG